MNKNNILFMLGMLVPTVLIFGNVFFKQLPTLGDAPNFYDQEFTELISEPIVWTNRGENLGGIDPRIFIYPLLVIYGYFGKLGFGNDLIIKGMFYLPGIIFSLIGLKLISRYLKLSKLSQFFASFFYLFNTYFILLVDGGQVGIVLAYGLFPLVVYSFLKYLCSPSYKTYFLLYVSFVVITIADPRLAIISLFTSIVWSVFEKKEFSKSVFTRLFVLITLVVIPWIGTNLYWLLPAISLKQVSLSLSLSDLKLLSLSNGLFIFQPHWPENVFGKISWPLWYFVGVPILILGTQIFKNTKKNSHLLLMFLLFVFLLKGNSPPFGFIYDFVVTKMPLGASFRDSSKFFTPLVLIGGLLIAQSIDLFTLKYIKLREISIILIFAYLLVLVYPSMSSMNFVLSDRTIDKNILNLSEHIKSDNDFYRTAWFPERHPLVYETNMNPALDAKSLVNIPLLSNISVGSSDKFNYIYQSNRFIDIYKMLGIKYLIFSKDQRNPYPNEDEVKEWERLVHYVDNIDALKKINLANDLPIYKIEDTYPRTFIFDKMVAVVGPELKNSKLNFLELYLEDGKIDPLDLQGMDGLKGKIYLNNRDKDDLTMSFLQKYYISTSESDKSDWKYYKSDEYLDWKYQLLIKDLVVNEFDYGKGVSISSNSNEEIQIAIDSDLNQDVVLAIRSLGFSNSKLGYSINNTQEVIVNSCINFIDNVCEDTFGWITNGIKIVKGSNLLTINNIEGLNVVNAIAVVPVEEWNSAQAMTDTYISHFGVLQNKTELDVFTSDATWKKINSETRSPVWYDFEEVEDSGWVVLSESFNIDWKMKIGNEYLNSVPAFSTLNGFYYDSKWGKASLKFVGQDTVRWGMYYTVLTLLLMIIIVFERQKNKNG